MTKTLDDDPRFRDLDALIEPAIFWYWNSDPTPDDIRTRLDQIEAKGFRSVYVHPMPDEFRPNDFHGGMKIPYLSPRFFELIELVCRELGRRGMVMWLYDEGGWPSGMANGQVVAQDPAFGAWGLRRLHGKIEPVQFLDEVPYPDLMNEQATACFIRTTHDRYQESIGDAFGRTVRGIFTDEPRILGCLGTDTIPWSPCLSDFFEQLCGYPLEDVVEFLFEPGPHDDRCHRARRDYLRAMSALIGRSYFVPLESWCDRHGLILEGHHTGENEFSRHGQFFGHYLDQARHYHVPGVDVIWRQIFPGQPGGNYVSLAASSAWIRGLKIALSESFNVFGAGLTIEQMKWIASFQLVRGVNRIGFMPLLESVTGPRRISTCSDFSPLDPRWKDMDLFLDFIRNTARFTLTGTPRPTVGVFYRTELLAGEDAKQFDRDHEAICDRIGDQLNALVFVGIQELKDARLRSGAIQIRDLELNALVVHTGPDLEDEELDVLGRLLQDGLPIVCVGGKSPAGEKMRAAHGESAALEMAHEPEDIDLAWSSLLELQCPLQGVRLLPLDSPEGLNLLFFNQNLHAVDIIFDIRDSRPGTGLIEHKLEESCSLSINPLRRQDDHYHLRLYPGQLRALIPLATAPVPTMPWHQIGETKLDSGWESKAVERFVIEDDIRREPVQDDWRPAQMPLDGPAEFCGSTHVRHQLNINPVSGQRQILDLGTVHQACEVFLNGQSVGRRAWGPWWFDLTSDLKTGLNDLEIRITNTLAGQWLRPEIHNVDRVRSPNFYLELATPFMKESLQLDLLGPAVLRQFQPQNPES